MKKRALLVHPAAYSDLAEDMKKWLNEASGKNGDNFGLDLEKYQQDAEMCMKEEDYDLLISHLNIQYNRDTSIQEQQRRRNGLDLLKHFRRSNVDVPALIISPMADKMSYQKLMPLAPADLITDGIDLERDFKKAFRRLFAPSGADKMEEAEKIAYLDISILLESIGPHYRIRGEGFAYEDEGGLVVNRTTIAELGQLSDEIARESSDRDPRWKEDLARLGKMLREQLFAENNKDFLKSYRDVLGLVNNKVENFRFRFVVEKETHRIIFESLMDDDNNFIMLHAPMHRRLAVRSNRYALFHDPEDKQRKLNCLVIRADVSGPVEELLIELDELANVDGEVRFWDEDLRAEPCVDTVEIIDSAEGGRTYFETVMHYLREHNWDIVHFAGHSAYIRKTLDDENKKGYLFFPGDEEGQIKAVPLELFASLLYDANVRLVYLSSCHSSEKGFVFEMVQQNVPAAVGFRWDIEDDMAEKFTRNFYTHLLNKKSLEGAFLETRKDLYFTENDNPIWAAAMLVVQI